MNNNIELEIRINVFKYYHAANSDYYEDLNDKERKILLKYLNTKGWMKSMSGTIWDLDTDHEITNVEYIELPINGKKRLHAVVNVQNTWDLKPKKIIQNITETLDHYQHAGYNTIWNYTYYFSKHKSINGKGKYMGIFNSIMDDFVDTKIYEYNNKISGTIEGKLCVNIYPKINIRINGKYYNQLYKCTLKKCTYIPLIEVECDQTK